MHDLNGFQRDILYAVPGLEEPSGLEVIEAIEESYETEITSSRFYVNVQPLEDMGLVGDSSREGSRDNSYFLTDRGRRELQARREWEDEFLENCTL
jgi:PadR family transcriptional regulator PadR